MKKNILIVAAALLAANLFSQENPDTSYWHFNGLTGINISQVSLTNWSAGGESSYSGNALVNLNLRYIKDKNAWENVLGLGYGLMKQGEQSVRKTDDRIDFASKYGRKATKKLYYSAMLKFNTQFTDGFDYPNDSVPISRFMAPGIINLSVGIDYKPAEYFSLYVGPLSGKVTIVRDDSLSADGAFGVEPGENVRFEFGGSMKAVFEKEILKNVTFNTKLDLFSNYIKNPEKVDVSWEVMINLKVNEYLSANLHTHLLWDDDIKFAQVDDAGNITGDPVSKVQFKEVFGVGFSYKF
jgi:hypothetical protein